MITNTDKIQQKILLKKFIDSIFYDFEINYKRSRRSLNSINKLDTK